MIQKLKHMYQFEPEVYVIAKRQSWWNLNRFQKQSFADVLQNGVLKNFANSTGNTCVGDTFKLSRNPVDSIKKRFQDGCFSVKFAKFFNHITSAYVT